MKDVCFKVDVLINNRGSVKLQMIILLLKLIYGLGNLDYVFVIKWGRDNEDMVMRELYVFGFVNYINCNFLKCGLYVFKDKFYIGVSLDGFMYCLCCG